MTQLQSQALPGRGEGKPRYTVVYEGDPADVKILSGERAPGKAIAVVLGDQYAEAGRSEKHRNDLMDTIVSLRTERGALRSREEAFQAAAAALTAIVEFCDDPNGSEKGVSLAMGLAGLLPAARAALAKATAA